MGKNTRLKELYEAVDNVKPLAEKDGQVYVTFDDAAILNSYYADEPRTGLQTKNPDGTLASTGKRVHAVNPAYFFANRYKVKGKKLYIVSGHTIEGYRSIKEQASGRVFIKTIPVHIVVRDDDGNLKLEKVSTVSDTEFISDYTNVLDNESMAKILPILTAHGSDISTSSMPI